MRSHSKLYNLLLTKLRRMTKINFPHHRKAEGSRGEEQGELLRREVLPVSRPYIRRSLLGGGQEERDPGGGDLDPA